MLLTKLPPATSKVVSFFVSSLLCLCAGSLYGFGAFSQNFSKVLASLSHGPAEDVEIVGSIGDLGLYLGIIGGIFYDRFGSQWTAIYAAVLGTTGFSLVGLTLRGYLYPKAWICCIYFFLIGQASYCMYLNAMSSSLKSFGVEHKGKLTGYFLALYGLSSVIYTLIYEHLLHSDVANLFLVFTLTTAFVNSAAIFLVGQPADEDEDNTAESVTDIDPTMNQEPAQPLLKKEGEEISGIELLKQPLFWLVFITFLLAAGIGLLWKNVLGSLGATLDMHNVPTMVITWSLVNTAARIIMGFLGDWFAHIVPRPAWGIPFIIAIFGSMLSFFWVTEDNLVVTVWVMDVAIGIGYGAIFCLASGLTAIYFGMKSVGKNLGLVTLAPAIGGLSFNAITTGLLKLNEEGCKGPKCYSKVFYFVVPMAGLCLLASIVLTIMHVKKDREKNIQYV